MDRDRRLLLDDILTSITPNVYFQTPNNLQMEYPCIVYKLNAVDTKFADNSPYSQTRGYEVTVIDRDPESVIVDALAALPLCTFSSSFVTENLYHVVFSLYF